MIRKNNAFKKSIFLLPLFFIIAHFAFGATTTPVQVVGQPTLTIDDIYVSHKRADVSSLKVVGFHIVYTSDNSPLQWGKVYFEHSSSSWFTNAQGWVIFEVYSNEIGVKSWSVDRIYYGDTQLEFHQHESDPSIIFDKVIIELTTSSPRIGVGSQAEIEYSAHYAYDETPFEGEVKYNRNLISTKVGKVQFTVESIEDDQYDLTNFESNSVDIIYDRVAVFLSPSNTRIDVGTNAEISIVHAQYLYDYSEFIGEISLNDTMKKNTVGKYAFSAAVIYDPLYEVDSVISNVVEVVFDDVIIDIDINDDHINVGGEANITISAKYAYDSLPFQGRINLNENDFISSIVQHREYYVSSISDHIYKLTTFTSNTVEVIWDRIHIDIESDEERVNVGDSVDVSWIGYYEFDQTSFIGLGIVVLNSYSMTKDTVGSYTFKVSAVEDSVYGITQFSSTPKKIIWDLVNVDLEFPLNRIGVGTEAKSNILATYAYDGTEFDGSVHLNDSLVQDMIGRYTYTTSNIQDKKHGVNVFNSNTASCIWDLVNVEFDFPLERIGIGIEAKPTISATYGYDGILFNGKIQLNDSLVKNEIGRYTYTTSAIQDNRFSVTSFQSNIASCTWDNIIIEKTANTNSFGAAQIIVKMFYETDGRPIDKAKIAINDKVYEVQSGASYTFEISTWSPIITVDTQVISQGFPGIQIVETYYCLGNISIFITVSSGLFVSSILIMKKRRTVKELETIIIQRLESEGNISFSEQSEEFQTSTHKILTIINNAIKRGKISGVNTHDDKGFISEKALRTSINDFTSSSEELFNQIKISEHPRIQSGVPGSIRLQDIFTKTDFSIDATIDVLHPITSADISFQQSVSSFPNQNIIVDRGLICHYCLGTGFIQNTSDTFHDGKGTFYISSKCTMCQGIGYSLKYNQILEIMPEKWRVYTVFTLDNLIEPVIKVQIIEKEYELGKKILELTPKEILDFDSDLDREITLLMAPTLFSERDLENLNIKSGIFIPKKEVDRHEESRQQEPKKISNVHERNFLPKIETVTPEAQKLFEEMKKRRAKEMRQRRER